jgi:hypothetical protein
LHLGLKEPCFYVFNHYLRAPEAVRSSRCLAK